MFNRIESRSFNKILSLTILSSAMLKVLTGCTPESTNTNKPVNVQPTRPNISEPTATSVIEETEVEPTANVPVIISTVEAIEAAETEEAGQPKELDLRGATLSVESGVDEDDDYNEDVTSLIKSIDKSENIESFTIYVYADRLEMESEEDKLVAILDRDSGEKISLFDALETASRIDGLDLPTDLLKDGEIFYAINGELRILIYRNNKWEVINHDKVGLDQLAINQINALMGTNYDLESLPFSISEDGKIIYDSYDVPLLKMVLNENNEYEWQFATLEFLNGYSTSMSNKDIEIGDNGENQGSSYKFSINAFTPETVANNSEVSDNVKLAEEILNRYIIEFSSSNDILEQLTQNFGQKRSIIQTMFATNSEFISKNTKNENYQIQIGKNHKFHLFLTYETALNKLPIHIREEAQTIAGSLDKKFLVINLNENESIALIISADTNFKKLESAEVTNNRVLNSQNLELLYLFLNFVALMSSENDNIDFSIDYNNELFKNITESLSKIAYKDLQEDDIKKLLEIFPLIIRQKNVELEETSMKSDGWREKFNNQFNRKQI